MRNVLIAAALAIGASAALYLVATMVGLPADVAKGLAGLPAFAIKNIYEFLEVRTAKQAIVESGSEAMITLNAFSIRPHYLLLVGAVMIAGMLPVVGGITGFLSSVAGAAANYPLNKQGLLVVQLVIFHSFPLKIIGSVYVGRWIGGRSSRHSTVIALGSVLLGSYAAFAISMIVINDEMYEALQFGARTSQTVMMLAINLVPDVVIFMIASSIGAWSGRRRRFMRYMAFILRLLPPATRETIVDLARDEAAKITLRQDMGGSATSRV